jgi:nicotinate-nucleotide--dimethylbenzimidazole phosphoribosyltransferase
MATFFDETIAKIRPADVTAVQAAYRRWDSIAKPLKSLGRLEDMIAKVAGGQRTADVKLDKKTLVTFCSDNGIVAEGVTQTGQEVTSIVADNLATGRASAALLCDYCGAKLIPVDIGMVHDVPSVRDEKIASGTKDFLLEDAMTRSEAIRSIEIGMRIASEEADLGTHLLAAGEMGIGNTSTSSAVACILLGKEANELVGRGAGLSSEGLEHKTHVIAEAINRRNPDRNDPVDVLAKVGGYDIGGMTGLYLGAASRGIPVILDGVISETAALLAARIAPAAKDYMIPSHLSSEPAAALIFQELGMEAPLRFGLHAGEGCGAVLLFPLLDMACRIYQGMPSFEETHIEAYQSFDNEE